MKTVHTLRINYASGEMHQEMKYSIATAFFPIGWALLQVWQRMVQGMSANLESNDVFIGYCKLLERARRLLPNYIWKHFFAKGKARQGPAVLTNSGGGQAPPVSRYAAKEEGASTAEKSEKTTEAPNALTVKDAVLVLKNHSTRLLSSPDAPGRPPVGGSNAPPVCPISPSPGGMNAPSVNCTVHPESSSSYASPLPPLWSPQTDMNVPLGNRMISSEGWYLGAPFVPPVHPSPAGLASILPEEGSLLSGCGGYLYDQLNM